MRRCWDSSRSKQICSDPDDDKFLACALASSTKVISSGDKTLRKTSGYAGIEVLSPREFIDKYLKKNNQPTRTSDGNTRADESL